MRLERAIEAQFSMAMYIMPGSLERIEPVGRSWEAGQFLVPVRNNNSQESGYENGVREQEVN